MCSAVSYTHLDVYKRQLWFSATKVAFINYQVISLGQISKANDNSFIKISELSTDDLNRLTGYDMVFINAMGLRITEEQRAEIQINADLFDNAHVIASTLVSSNHRILNGRHFGTLFIDEAAHV